MWVNIQRITGVPHCANVVWPDLVLHSAWRSSPAPFERRLHQPLQVSTMRCGERRGRETPVDTANCSSTRWAAWGTACSYGMDHERGERHMARFCWTEDAVHVGGVCERGCAVERDGNMIPG